MPKFSIKDLMMATLIAAVGLGTAITWLHDRELLAILGFGLAGVGVVSPFKQVVSPVFGFFTGCLLGFGLVLTMWGEAAPVAIVSG